jgi:hypothetical protein
VIAINKAQMYAGAATSWFYHDLSSNYDTLNPARNIGTTASPNTEPGYFISVDSNICPPTCSNLYEWKCYQIKRERAPASRWGPPLVS